MAYLPESFDRLRMLNACCSLLLGELSFNFLLPLPLSFRAVRMEKSEHDDFRDVTGPRSSDILFWVTWTWNFGEIKSDWENWKLVNVGPIQELLMKEKKRKLLVKGEGLECDCISFLPLVTSSSNTFFPFWGVFPQLSTFHFTSVLWDVPCVSSFKNQKWGGSPIIKKLSDFSATYWPSGSKFKRWLSSLYSLGSESRNTILSYHISTANGISLPAYGVITLDSIKNEMRQVRDQLWWEVGSTGTGQTLEEDREGVPSSANLNIPCSALSY